MRRSCAVAIAAFAALAIAPQVLRRRVSFAATGLGQRSSDEFAVSLLEAISEERDAGTTGVPLLTLVNVCPRWPFCNDAKVLIYTLHEGKVIFYWYRKDEPCSIEYHASGPCENGETKGFEILARIIEDRKDGLEVKDGRLMWGNKYVYAFSLQGLQIHKFAFTGRIFFQKESRKGAYFSVPVSVSRSSLTATGPEKPEGSIIPGVPQSASHEVPTSVWALGFGFVVIFLATSRRRSRRRKEDKEDEISNPFISSMLSNVSVVDLADESNPGETKEAGRYPEKKSRVESSEQRCEDVDSLEDKHFEKEDAVPMGSLESTCAPSSVPSSSMSHSALSSSFGTLDGKAIRP